jgi:hypothetical protein
MEVAFLLNTHSPEPEDWLEAEAFVSSLFLRNKCPLTAHAHSPRSAASDLY